MFVNIDLIFMLLHLTNFQILNIYSYLSNKNLPQSVQNTFLKIFFKYGTTLVLLSDIELTQLTGLDKSSNRKHLSILEKSGMLLRHDNSKKIFRKKRKVQIVLPEYLIPQKNNNESQSSLTFTGTVVKKIETKYHGKKIVDVELRDVRNDTGNITFEKYWIEETYIVGSDTDTDTDLVLFKANLKIITDSKVLLVPVKNQLHA